MRNFWKSHFLTLVLIAIDVLAMSIIWREAWQLRSMLTGSWFDRPINEFTFYRHAMPFLIPLWVIVRAIFQQ